MNDWDDVLSQSMIDAFATAVESLECERHEAEVYAQLIGKHVDAYREDLGCHDPITNITALVAVMDWVEERTTKAAEILRDVNSVLSALGRE